MKLSGAWASLRLAVDACLCQNDGYRLTRSEEHTYLLLDAALLADSIQ